MRPNDSFNFPLGLIKYIVIVRGHTGLRGLYRALKLCESRGGRPGLPVPNSPYGLCGLKASLNEP